MSWSRENKTSWTGRLWPARGSSFEQEPDDFDVGSVHHGFSTSVVPSLRRAVQRLCPSRFPAAFFAAAAQRQIQFLGPAHTKPRDFHAPTVFDQRCRSPRELRLRSAIPATPFRARTRE